MFGSFRVGIAVPRTMRRRSRLRRTPPRPSRLPLGSVHGGSLPPAEDAAPRERARENLQKYPLSRIVRLLVSRVCKEPARKKAGEFVVDVFRSSPSDYSARSHASRRTIAPGKIISEFQLRIANVFIVIAAGFRGAPARILRACFSLMR